MTIELFGHPFSSYTWKALIAFYENDTRFTFRELGPDFPDNGAEFGRRWPIAKFPLLVEGDTQVMEASSIIEYLDDVHPGPTRFVPADRAAAREVRMLDRIFDRYVMDGMQDHVNDALKPAERKDPAGVEQAGRKLDTAYAWLGERMRGRGWAVGDTFTLADCAAAPSLFYADWVRPMPDGPLKDYRARLLARPSVKRVVDEARPYRHLFPLGAPDRD